MARQTTSSDKDANNVTSNEFIIPIPVIYNKQTRDLRKCERYNYIPHNTPANSNRYDWHNAYINQLMDMYYIVVSVINEIYPQNNIKWYNNVSISHNLSRLIYHCSSKYIDHSTEVKCYDMENESKDLRMI